MFRVCILYLSFHMLGLGNNLSREKLEKIEMEMPFPKLDQPVRTILTICICSQVYYIRYWLKALIYNSSRSKTPKTAS